MVNSNLQKIFALIVAASAWFSLAAQFYIISLSGIYYLSYFTTLCNLLIAVSLSCAVLIPASAAGKFFSKLSVQSAIALYIFIVSVVYNTVLRGLLVLEGWEYFLDNMVHVVNPVLYILYWLFYRASGKLVLKDGINWLIFPLIYLIYSLIRGAVLNWYPYPFLNAGRLGYPAVLLNIAVMLAVFLAAGMGMIVITRWQKN